MSRWRPTIFTFLFLVFSVIILITIGIFSVANYQTINSRLSTLAIDNLVALSRTLVVNVDNQLLNMNRISMVPVFSRTFKDLWASKWRDAHNGQAMFDFLTSVDGTFQGVRRINIYNLDREMIGTGNFGNVQSVDVTTKIWYPTVKAAGGERIISGVQVGQTIDRIATFDRNRRFISLCRYFTDPDTGRSGVIEVAQECGDLFQYLNVLSAAGANGRRIVIIGNDGSQIYPYQQKVEDLSWIVAGRPQDISIQAITSPNPEDGRPTILSYSHSLDADWTLVMIQDEEHLYADTADLARQIIFYAMLVSLVALVGAFWAARWVSGPLHRLSNRMARFSLDEAAGEQKSVVVASGLAELAGLSQSFEHLQRELRQSFAEAVLLRAHKHRAQLLALQSQMNPHFMFNMLATISVLAENEQTLTIPMIINDLAEMMRYIASSEETGHTLGQEFDFVRRYFKCLQHRFQDDLVFVASCPADLEETIVPRLLLQPFIENAIKHCTKLRPPWRFSVMAGSTGLNWWVLIEDNGPGFSPESLANLESEFVRIRSVAPGLADLPDLHVQGLGMINSFVRLRLSYGDNAVMELKNRPEGGASVCLGGIING